MVVIIETTPEARKKLVVFRRGSRETAQRWREPLVDRKARGLQ